MMNELYTLSQTLEHWSLLSSTTNPNVGTVGKCHCLLIELASDGKPKSIRILEKAQTGVLWKHSKGNHNSFPAIRVQSPLLCEEESRKLGTGNWKKWKLTEKQSFLQELNYSAVNPDSKDIILSDWSRQELASVLTDDQLELEALRRLIKRFPDKSSQSEFYESLVQFLREQIEQSANETMIDCLITLLVGTWDAKKAKYVSGLMTYFDIYETHDVLCKVIGTETSAALINLLNRIDTGRTSPGEQVGVCALSNKQKLLVRNKYPNPNLPLLGLTYFYSKKEDTPCLTRYGMSGTKAFAASEAAATAMNDALAFLTKPERKDITWSAITDSNRDKPDLLLAYLADAPENDALLAKILCDPNDQEDIEETFDSLCRQVIGGIKPVLEKDPNSIVNLIILETLDPGRKQIVYGNSFLAKQMEDNVLDWSKASENHPEILIRFYEGKEERIRRPTPIGPNELCRLLKMHYGTSGSTKPQKSSAISLQDIYRLYMPRSSEEASDNLFLTELLEKTLRRTWDMLAGYKQQMTLTKNLKGVFASEVKKACMAISLISVLLWRLGIRKEIYMRESSFNIGQLLQLADMLHKEYCVQVRNNGDRKKPLPSQLIGNELLSVAAENPNDALNRLRERIKIYAAWANTATGSDIGLAKWILARIREICAKVSNDIPEAFSPAEQAQVLLGYLAAIPYEKKGGTTNV